MKSERGSATIWVLAFVTLIAALALVGQARTMAVLARHRLERAADLTALAAAQQIGRSGDPCTAASRIAVANGARLERCQAKLDSSGRSGTVSVVLTCLVQLPIAGAQKVTAGARAGRLPAS